MMLLCTLLALSGCEFEVPITSRPTDNVNVRLLGNWASADGNEKMQVRRWDDATYAVWYNGDLFRAFHSDSAGMPLVSVQALENENRKYSYISWKLSEDGARLALRSISSKVIPAATKDSQTVRELIQKNIGNPALLNEEQEFVRQK